MRSVPFCCLQLAVDRTIGQVAAGCGDADHAHLVRDVTALAGCTPTELVGARVPFVLDTRVAGP